MKKYRNMRKLLKTPKASLRKKSSFIFRPTPASLIAQNSPLFFTTHFASLQDLIATVAHRQILDPTAPSTAVLHEKHWKRSCWHPPQAKQWLEDFSSPTNWKSKRSYCITNKQNQTNNRNSRISSSKHVQFLALRSFTNCERDALLSIRNNQGTTSFPLGKKIIRCWELIRGTKGTKCIL